MLSPIEIWKMEYEKTRSGIRTIPVSSKDKEIKRLLQKFENSSNSSNMLKHTRNSEKINKYSKMLKKRK
ncbi:MAG: hypothetical protein HFJ12_03030 [Bacilli bacterium]|nr:hypothetical protein [Bacilli bacterium]